MKSTQAGRFLLLLFVSIGQVVFQESALTGLMIFIGLCVNDVRISLVGLWAVAVAVVTAKLFGLDKGNTDAGLYTFNAHLLGLSIATFVDFDGSGSGRGDAADHDANNTVVVAVATLFAVLTVVISVALEKAFSGSRLPYLTLPFNIAALWFLGGTSRYSYWNTHDALIPPHMVTGNGSIGSGIESCLRREADDDCKTTSDNWAEAIVLGTLSGMSQVFFAPDWVAGLLVMLGIAMNSPISAALAVLASLLGVLLGLGLGTDGYGTGIGLEGYDLVLTAIAVGGGVFCHRDVKALAIAVVATTATFFVHGSLQAFFRPMGWPSLTLGFCVTTLPVLLLRETATRPSGSVLFFLDAVPPRDDPANPTSTSTAVVRTGATKQLVVSSV